MRAISFVALLLINIPLSAQAVAPATAEIPQSQSAKKTIGVPDWLPFPIPTELYEKWRKYGEWDYKQQSFNYRDATLTNFGATGAAAGLNQKFAATPCEVVRSNP